MYAEAGLLLPVFSQGFLQEVAGGGYEVPYSHLPLSGDESLLNFDVGIADGGLNLVCLLSGWMLHFVKEKNPKVSRDWD